MITYVNNKRKKKWSVVGENQIVEKINDFEDPNEIQNVTYGNIAICKNITNIIENLQFSLRQIDELIFQYMKCKQWKRLKEIISSIEVFSILYTPETKHFLA